MGIQTTSLQAYNSIRESLGKKQYDVLRVLEMCQPLTNKEIAEFLKLEINKITPRCKELREKGLVKQHGYKIVDGRRSMVWKPMYERINSSRF